MEAYARIRRRTDSKIRNPTAPSAIVEPGRSNYEIDVIQATVYQRSYNIVDLIVTNDDTIFRSP